MNDPLASDPPNGSIRLHDAMKNFLPAEMWDDYARAVEAQNNLPKRPNYFEMSARDWAGAKARSKGTSQGQSPRDHYYQAVNALLSEMKRKFETGELTAFVRDDPPFGPWRMIPASAWHNLRITDFVKGKAKSGAMEICDIHVLPSDHDDPVPTGMPGRKSLGAALIRIEYERRVAAGELEPTLAAESRWLAAWYLRTHPKQQPVTAKTIENNLRDDFRKAKTRQA